MKNAVLTLQFVTPAIIAGADQKTAELRAPSVRGSLRHWCRVLGYDSETERAIFGGIGKQHDEGRSSSVIVRVTSDIPKTQREVSTQMLTGNKFDYFAWPFSNPNNARGIICDGETASLLIRSRSILGGKELPPNVLQAFLLLGGLGTRSRRAYGSIWPKKIIIDDQEWVIPQNIESFQASLKDVFSLANIKVIALSTGNTTWIDAVNTCSDYLRTFRCGKTMHGQTASQWGEHDHDLPFNHDDKIYRAAVALPLAQNYRTNKGNNFSIKYNRSDRWASPVCFKVVQLSGKYIPLVYFLQDYEIAHGEEVLNSRNHSSYYVDHDMLDALKYADHSKWRNKVISLL
ncbi:MAG: hypothetical protein EOL87_02105 [Spartobacteria bacterium]|nr:hypothetical protein [Spartobacteria bacterium]